MLMMVCVNLSGRADQPVHGNVSWGVGIVRRVNRLQAWQIVGVGVHLRSTRCVTHERDERSSCSHAFSGTLIAQPTRQSLLVPAFNVVQQSGVSIGSRRSGIQAPTGANNAPLTAPNAGAVLWLAAGCPDQAEGHGSMPRSSRARPSREHGRREVSVYSYTASVRAARGTKAAHPRRTPADVFDVATGAPPGAERRTPGLCAPASLAGPAAHVHTSCSHPAHAARTPDWSSARTRCALAAPPLF